MKHRLIMEELERVLKTIPNLRVERDQSQPEDEDELRDNGPIAILYTGERETSELGNKAPQLWDLRWEIKPVITVLISDSTKASQRDALEDIEDAFITALKSSRLNDNDLLAQGSTPDMQTKIRHPDEASIGGMEIFLNLKYNRK